MTSRSSSATSKGRSNCLAPIRFSVAFRVSKNIIEVPLSYHRQWRSHYPTYVLFQYNGTTHFVRLHKYGSRYFFSDGLKQFRRTHDIDDSVIMQFLAPDKNTSFEVDVIGPILRQGRPRSIMATRRHIFTADVTEHMMQQTLPLANVRGTTKLCNSARLMARIADKIKTIDGSKETLKLVVRITELWFIGTSGRSEQAEMVIVDSDGDQIHVVCKQDQLKAWKMDLKEDIIGVVDEVVFRHISPRSKRVVFKLMNLSNQLLSCTLWDDYYVQFLEYLDHHESEGPIIVLLTNARIKEGQELGIEIRSVFTRRSQWSSQPSGSAQLSSRETFISKSEAKTISEINNLCEEFVCVTVGTIMRVVMDNHSWCYAACIQCHKKTDVYTEPFVCPCGKHNDLAVLRYRVEVMINYKDESTKFLLWDRECTELIGQSADEVNTLKIEDGDLDLNASPKALDKLLGHLLAFKVKIQPQYKNSAVLKFSTDLTLINDVLDMLPDVETCSKIKVTTPFDSNDPVHYESVSFQYWRLFPI
ncbi:hypothetical protein JHK82_053060 [Glycine max]|nr:hypothetical protein JHK86_052906 [Glycine max]KAG4927279.1 hypothetical protein JHK85_053765 [Glycine max]KAG5082898.1 hypothetical protein JHK84_052936 [Glycine max]KAG5085663.1 hypothetical protein JHK82_053060 [Glycine max]